MRIFVITAILVFLGEALVFAIGTETQVGSNTILSLSLSGLGSSGVNVANIPLSAFCGLMGAGFLVLAVVRRRKYLYRIPIRRKF